MGSSDAYAPAGGVPATQVPNGGGANQLAYPGAYPPPQPPPGAYPAQPGYSAQNGYPQPPNGYPQGGYPPPASHPAQGEPVQGVVVVPAPPQMPTYWSRNPTHLICPYCRHDITTKTKKETGLGTWLIAGGLAFIGCIFGCCLIPFCVDECKDTVHTCPSCKRHVGVQKLV